MPRKKSEKLIDDQEEFDVDDPSEVEELENNASEDDWTPADEEKKGAARPQRASRNRKPVKLTDSKTTSDEEDEEDDEESRGVKRKRPNVAIRGGGGRGRGRGRGGGTTATVKKAKSDENGKGRGKKKAAAAADGEGDDDEGEDNMEDEEGMEEDEESVSDEEDSDDDSETEDSEVPPEYRSGKFVVLKADFDHKEENYPLWKIDGKSLLQKFDKFMHNDEELYKGTTIYAGWSKAIINTYYPIEVELKTLENGDSTVKFDPSQITPEMQKKKSTPATEAGGGDTNTNAETAATKENAGAAEE